MSRVTPLKRTAIIVRDMQRSLEFYGGVLGMNIWLQGSADAELPALYQLLGMPPCHTRWIILQSGEVDWGMVGLFELTEPAPDDDVHRNVDRANRGEACLVFHTPDVEAVYEGAKGLGLTILCPPTRLEIPDHGVVSKEMTLRDPNGVLVNLIQNLVGGPKVGLSNRFPGLREFVPERARARARVSNRRTIGSASTSTVRRNVKSAAGRKTKSAAARNAKSAGERKATSAAGLKATLPARKKATSAARRKAPSNRRSNAKSPGRARS